MQVRFQRANHRTGNESLVLKFDGIVDGQTACVLVDSGKEVDVDALLEDDEYLACVLVTHAHWSHICSLGDNVRDGAPVLAAEPTAAVLATALQEDGDALPPAATSAVDALESVDGWRSVLGGGDVRVHPVPAGHVPGAAGFVVQFRENDVARNVLVTGDFTTTAAGGFPGLPAELPVDVEAIVANVATSDDFEATLTDAVETSLSRASLGHRTLVTANPLSGVRIARLLDAAIDRWDFDATVRITGPAAAMFDSLEFSPSAVECHPDLGDPSAVLVQGDVTITTPESPVAGDAGRLFEAIEDDENAALVQLARSASETVTAAKCSTAAFDVQPHPTADVIDDVVDAYDPLHVVVGHASGAELDAYKDKYAAFVWANQDSLEQTLFADGEWQAPPWVSDRAERYVYGNTSEYGGNELDGRGDSFDVSLPAVEPGEVTLNAEGVDVSRLHDRFGDAPRKPSGESATTSDDVTLEDVVERLDRIEAALGDGLPDRDSVPFTFESTDDGVVLRLRGDVTVDDVSDVTVLVARVDESE